MNRIEIWYTIERHNGIWTVWLNKISNNGLGSYGLYSSSNKNKCINYCKMKGIKYEKNK